MLELNTMLDYKKTRLFDKKYYHKVRALYINRIIEFLKTKDIKTALELGSYIFSYFKDSDLMDRIQHKHMREIKYLNKAQEIPWKIQDKTYDIFIATQVWEHLKGTQREVFKEVKRVSKSALLSFPYKWDRRKHTKSHSDINMNVIKKWCLDMEPSYKFEIKGFMVCYWEFK